jgi:glycosyltransferase involved in cell wall biosynthesis
MRSMDTRVVHVLPHRGGGAETYIDQLEALFGYEHERVYLSAGRRPADAVASLPIRWLALMRRLREANILHCHGDATALLTLPLLPLRPAVITTHGLNLLRRLPRGRRRLAASSFALSARLSRAVICTSEAERAELEPLLRPEDRTKLRVIANAVDPGAAYDEQERRSIRRELGLAPEAVMGLFVGELEHIKGPLIAASAATRVRASGNPFVLVMAGDGSLAARMQLYDGDAVKVLGFRRDVPRLLAAADLLVHPAAREGCPYAVLDAMVGAVSVVATDCPGTREATGDTALLCPPGDIDALTAAVARLAGDGALRASLGRAARQRVTERFSTTRFLAATAEAYARTTGAEVDPAMP